MTLHAETDLTPRRAALARARQSRRPSRLGLAAGSASEPDRVLAADAGFPGLLARTWRTATAAETLHDALGALLTLGGHVPADIQLMALRPAEECALKALFGVSWRSDEQLPVPRPPQAQPAFVGELGLTTGGRVVVGVPSQGPLAEEEHLVDGVIRIPWSARDLAAYRDELRAAAVRRSSAIADCREWLGSAGEQRRLQMLQELMEAASRTAPFVLYQEGKRYTNFREHNTLTGKTLWPGHPDCALSSLRTLPLGLWSDSDSVMVVCLTLLVRSAGFGRIEEANGTQLTVDHVAELLERTRRSYNRAHDGEPVAPAARPTVQALCALADALRERRKELGGRVRLYREIHGPLMHKVERVAGAWTDVAQARADDVCAHLRERLPIAGDSLEDLATRLAASPLWLAQPHGGFATGLESLVYETVRAAQSAFDADFAMSRGIRSLSQLVRALRAESWAEIVGWELPQYYCCVLARPEVRERFEGSPAELADIAWAISARMQYNSWHFLPGNLPRVPEVLARDYFVPPTMPDIAYFSDQHHRGHVAAQVRFSIRSPQAVTVLDRLLLGFVDLRVLRCEGPPFDEQDLLAAHRTSAFIAQATTAAATLAAAGHEISVASFDPAWHWHAMVGDAPGLDDTGPPTSREAGPRPISLHPHHNGRG